MATARRTVARQRFKLGEYRRHLYRQRRLHEATRTPDQQPGRAPDYVGIGVQRAGTSRWNEMICEHPDASRVYDPAGREVKEIHWFDQPVAGDHAVSDRAYLRWFQAPSGRVVGEWTPRYLYDLWPIDRLQVACPDAKILVLLRDPLDRLRSALRFYERRGVALDRDTAREAIWRGLYGPQLEYLFDRWPRNRVFVGLYEANVAHPERELRRLYEFLDLDPSFVPPGLERVVNDSRPAPIDPWLLDSARSLYESDRPRVEAILPDVDLSGWQSIRA